jgi:hypothetical protein
MESKLEITPNLVEKGDQHDDPLQSTLHHGPRRPKQRGSKSKLPGPLYILSFAPPFPRITQNPLGTLTHPYTLYIIGILAALVAGVGLPAFDIIYGYWTTGITNSYDSNEAIASRGQHAGWLMTIVGFVTLGSFIAFLGCCKWGLSSFHTFCYSYNDKSLSLVNNNSLTITYCPLQMSSSSFCRLTCRPETRRRTPLGLLRIDLRARSYVLRPCRCRGGRGEV